MPAAFFFESDEVDQGGYDAVMEAVGRASIDAPNSPGFIAHLSGPKPGGGWRVVDVWESEEAANAFYGQDQFQAAVGSLPGVQVSPWPLHRVEIDRTLRHLG